MAKRFVLPTWQVFDSNGDPISGAKLNFYSTGTSTRKDTFSDSALATANANPVVADSAGRFGNIFLEAGNYRVVFTDADDVTIWDRDPVEGNIGGEGAVDEKTSAYTVTVDDESKIIACDATAGAFTVTLPAAATAGDGFAVTIKKTDSGSNAVTVDANGAETIDGAATFSLPLQNHSVTLRCDGTNWQVVATTRTATANLDNLAVSTAKIAADAVTKDKMLDSALGGLLRNYLSGLGLSQAVDTDHDITIAAGTATAADQSHVIELASAITKQIDAAWAVGTNAGGLDTGAVANSTWYHLWLIRRSDTGVVDALFSTSATSPTMPANYDQKRRIGSVKTDGSANIVAFVQVGDEFLLKTPVQDASGSDPGISAVTVTLGSVPTGVQVEALLSFYANDASPVGDTQILITCMSQSDTAPSTSLHDVFLEGSAGSQVPENIQVRRRTNTSAQIRMRFSQSTADHAYRFMTAGWIDRRGRDD